MEWLQKPNWYIHRKNRCISLSSIKCCNCFWVLFVYGFFTVCDLYTTVDKYMCGSIGKSCNWSSLFGIQNYYTPHKKKQYHWCQRDAVERKPHTVIVNETRELKCHWNEIGVWMVFLIFCLFRAVVFLETTYRKLQNHHTTVIRTKSSESIDMYSTGLTILYPLLYLKFITWKSY